MAVRQVKDAQTCVGHVRFAGRSGSLLVRAAVHDARHHRIEDAVAIACMFQINVSTKSTHSWVSPESFWPLADRGMIEAGLAHACGDARCSADQFIANREALLLHGSFGRRHLVARYRSRYVKLSPAASPGAGLA